MPSLILTGHPSTGKSTFARLLSERALSHKSNLIQSTVIINEESARPDKTTRECYANSTEEKLTRSALKSEFDKYVKDSSKLVILDSMNYIKGFRYELHCISKAAGQKHGVIWLMCKEDVGKAWNKKRRRDEKPNYFYSEEQMEELIQRYEPPDQRNRWDRPLYRVDVVSTLKEDMLRELGVEVESENENSRDNDDESRTGKTAEDILKKSVYNMHSLSEVISDKTQSKVVTSNLMAGKSFRRIGASKGFQRAVKKEDENHETTDVNVSRSDPKNEEHGPPLVDSTSVGKAVQRKVRDMNVLIDEILDSFLLDVEALKEGMSTKLQPSASSNVLHDVDNISQETMNTFLRAQESALAIGGTSGTIVIPIGKGGQTCKMTFGRNLKIAEVKRLRRQYLKWITSHVPKDTSEDGIAKSFLSYIQSQV
jgi:protein KTI12